jgi:hypothetical protein
MIRRMTKPTRWCEVPLDRKLARTLSMLFRLKELRGATLAG